MTPVRLGVFASGRGSNLVALLGAIDRGDLPARVAVVVSNNSRAAALQHARAADIPAHHISGHTDPDPGAAALSALQAAGVELVVLAGYLKRLDDRIIAAYPGRVLNIHPAPLPRFGGPGMYGEHVHAAVLAAGVSHGGPTVHVVTGDYDRGPILGHRPVPVLPGDTAQTLAARVLQAEHDLYWRVIEARLRPSNS